MQNITVQSLEYGYHPDRQKMTTWGRLIVARFSLFSIRFYSNGTCNIFVAAYSSCQI